MILLRRKLIVSWVALITLGVGFALYTLSASAVDWPMFRFNPEHTAETPEVVIPPLAPLWTYDARSSVESSPAVSGGVVYVGIGNGKLYALNATTGTQIWNTTITTLNRAGSSPAVSNGVVYVGSWDHPNSRVFAFNATTGTQIWNTTAGIRVYSSPAVVEGIVYVGTLSNEVYAFNATTGAQIWPYITGDQVHSSPAVSGGIVYIGSDDERIYALNATTGAWIWTNGAYGSVRSSPAVSGGVVYVGSVLGGVYAFNATTGAFIWRDPLPGCEATYSSPAVSNGVVYIGSSLGVFALNATTGADIWNYTRVGYVLSSPAVSGDVVYVGSYDDNIHALNATTGTHIWNYTTGAEVYSSPVVSGGIVYVGSYDGKVYAFAPVTLQSIEFDGSTFPVSVVSNSMISDIAFNQPMKMISFDATGETGTAGCCKITIPKELLDAPPGEWELLVNDIPMTPTITWNATHTFIYVAYTHSVKIIKIIGTQAIPEFPSFLVLPLSMTATLLAVIVFKRRKHSMQPTIS